MDANIEAAGDAVTGTVVAAAMEKPSTAAKAAPATHICRNCKAVVAGKYCGACGQSAHVHRSLLSLGHDILHGVFHLEGRIWHTVPELFFKPGRLTRRYIDGERAKFVAPLPLFLFCVFFTFAVFSITSNGALENGTQTAGEAAKKWKEGNASAIEAINKQIEDLRAQLSAQVTPERRADLEKGIADLESARNAIEALRTADWERLTQKEYREDLKGRIEGKSEKDKDGDQDSFNINIAAPDATQKPFGDGKWAAAFRKAQENPGLTLYKVKTNTYKFSWALIPISLPFMWLLFFWRRDVRIYDHAVFVTYSISFMMLFMTLLAALAALGVSGSIWFSIFGIAAPLHVYKQLRQTYTISRAGAAVRLILLTVFIIVILMLFTSMLFVLGVIA